MNRLSIRIIFISFLIIMVGCASYKIPIQTENHPASAYVEVPQIELSALLDLSQESSTKNQESNVHLHH